MLKKRGPVRGKGPVASHRLKGSGLVGCRWRSHLCGNCFWAFCVCSDITAKPRRDRKLECAREPQ